MKRHYKKTALAMALVILMTSMSLVSSSAAEKNSSADVDYTISNPYANVNWLTWGQYKANLHCHTVASDGTNDFNDMIEKHYSLGYDFLAITDHGTVNYSWTEVNTVPVIGLIGKFKNKDFALIPTPLTQDRYQQITAGVGRENGMLQVPYGIENNPTSFNNAHVNSWFADYGNGILGGTSDYETPIKGVHEAGGLSVINHPGEYTSAKKENNPELAYNEDYDYYIKKFTTLLLKYDSCIGIDINSKTDSRTRNDRKLWDTLLKNCIPNGRSVMAIATSDAHRDSAIDSGWTVHCLPEQTVGNFRNSIETGAFFAGSHFIKNSKELGLIGNAIGENLGTEWEANTEKSAPEVKSVAVNDTLDTISVIASNAKLVRWISDGEQIATGTTIDLDDYSDKIGSYVRAEIFGEGGVLYTQAFVLKYDGAPTSNEFRFYDFGNLVAKLREVILDTLSDHVFFFDSFWKFITGNLTQVS